MEKRERRKVERRGKDEGERGEGGGEENGGRERRERERERHTDVNRWSHQREDHGGGITKARLRQTG